MTVGGDLRRTDYWRQQPALRASKQFKEWQHFIAFGPGFDLLVNFSRQGDRSRVVVMMHDHDWSGFVGNAVSARFDRAGVSCAIGASSMEIDSDGYTVCVEAPHRAVRLHLRFEPRTRPLTALAHPIGAGRALSWLMIPRMSVSGWCHIAGVRHEFDGIAGYHDHNWGTFAWGDDFTWEWAVILSQTPGCDDVLVVSSLQNRARTIAVQEQVLAFRGADNVLCASGSEVSLRVEGRRDCQGDRSLPPVMELLRRGCHADIPQRIGVRAAADSNELDAVLELGAHAALVLPTDDPDPLGIVTIHECRSLATVEMTLGDVRTKWEGRGVVELVRA